jgi:uncharacterized OsmC-like protein
MAAKIVNGVNVDGLMAAIDSMTKDPELGEFKFRVRNQWLGGTRNRATVQGFYGAKEEHRDRKGRLEYDLDEPPVLMGEDQGPNPVEFLLVGLSGCITTSLVAHAAARGITINSLESELEGDIDVRGFMDIDTTVPVGYKEIRFHITIDADATQEQLDELGEFAKNHSPVANTIMSPTPIRVSVTKR